MVNRQTEGEETILLFGGDAYEWYAHKSLPNAKHRLTLSTNHSNQFASDDIELSEESWSEKEQRWIMSGSMYITRIDPTLAEEQTANFLNSKSATERKEALQKINQQTHPERHKYNEIGLRDPSPDVRDIAAWFLRGEPSHFVPMLINVMANDSDTKVRASAGYSLTHFYTDNGSKGDLYIKPLEDNLDKLLIGLKRVETVRSVVEILGSKYTGGSFAPCFMSDKNREKVLKAIRNQLQTIRLQADEWKKGRASWSNELNEADHEINRAIENLDKCNLTN